MLKTCALQKEYKNGLKSVHILKGIDIEISQGDFISVVGPSGAGKSTLLHLLGGLDKPTKGNVVFEGMDINKINDNELSVLRNEKFGFVFQFYHLLAEFSVLENVMLPAFVNSNKVQNRKGVKEKAEDLLEKIGLSQRLRYFPNQLSGGEQQRVAIARALINNPRIVFCDEPTGNLDSETGDCIAGLLKDLNKKNNTTIIVVTHNEKLAQVGNRIMYLKDGIIHSEV